MRVTIIQINDVHGYLREHPELFLTALGPSTRTVGGYARIRSLIDTIRSEVGDGVLVLDNGDTLHGTHAAVSSRGEALVEPLQRLGVDAMTAHWDFAYGPEQLDRIIDRLPYPMLAANVYRTADDTPAYPGHTVLARGAARVGVIGVAASIVDKTMPGHFSTGLRFTDGIHEVRAGVRQLRERERVDLVVLLSHLGFPQDCRMAELVEGIDVIISGHTHNRLRRPFTVADTTIIQSGCHGSFIGRLDLEIGERVGVVSHQLLEVDLAVPADGEMTGVVDAILEPDRAWLETVVGETDVLLHRGTVVQCPMDDLLLEAIASSAGTDLAFSNGWRYGAPVPVGPITRGDLWDMVPSNPLIETVMLSGAELRAMLEENLERTFSIDPFRQQGGYVKRCHGVLAEIKIENPRGARLVELSVNGRPVPDAAMFPVAFLTTQAVPERFGLDRATTSVHAVDALERWCAQTGIIRRSPTSVIAV